MNRCNSLILTVGLGLLAPAGNAHAQSRLAETVELTGVLRGCIEQSKQDSQADSESRPVSGFDYFMGISADQRSKGTISSAIPSAEPYVQWSFDASRRRQSAPYTLPLMRGSKSDEAPIHTYQSSSVFPLDDQLWSNSGGWPADDFRSAFEPHSQFTFRQDTQPVFSLLDNDNVCVLINGQFMIAVGGIHSHVQPVAELDRLGLIDGNNYPLDFFFAERHRTQSNFRVDTTLLLESANASSVSAVYD